MVKQIQYALARAFMKTVGQLSDGIRLCYQEGLTSGKMLDYIYQNRPAGKCLIGRLLDQRFLSDPGWEAVRIRRRHLEQLIIKAINELKSQNRAVSLLDIASGPGAYVLSVISQVGEEGLSARCRDFEQRWVAEGQASADKMGLKNVTFEHGDAFNRDEVMNLQPRPNLAIASGFYDWFNEDDKVQQSIDIVFAAIENGGYFVLSNQCAHPKLEFTEQVFTDFNKQPLRMTMRSKEKIHAMLQNAGFEIEETLADENNYYSVTKARKP